MSINTRERFYAVIYSRARARSQKIISGNFIRISLNRNDTSSTFALLVILLAQKIFLDRRATTNRNPKDAGTFHPQRDTPPPKSLEPGGIRRYDRPHMPSLYSAGISIQSPAVAGKIEWCGLGYFPLSWTAREGCAF